MKYGSTSFVARDGKMFAVWNPNKETGTAPGVLFRRDEKYGTWLVVSYGSGYPKDAVEEIQRDYEAMLLAEVMKS